MADHDWCRDIPRDEAVRAAEDGRSGPLPTLAEAISRAGQFTPPEATQPPNCTERESGLRTERVTLECVHSFEKHPSLWDWWRLMELRPGESVRVVDAAKLAPAANAEVGSNHASPVASVVPSVIRDMTDIIRGNADPDEKHAAMATLVEAVCPGCVLAPAASGAAGTANWFAAVGKFGMKNVCMAFNSFEECEKFADGDVRTVCLYAAPQAATGWLTAEERGALERAFDLLCDDDGDNPLARTVQKLLARSSPPEVVLPVSTIGRGERYDGDWVEGWIACRELCAAALAAAGVTVKEVG